MFGYLGADVPHDDLVTLLVFLASNLMINAAKALKLEADWLKVNALLSTVIAAGVGLIAQGETLERVLVGAAALVISAGSAAVVHRGGDTVSAGVTHIRAIAKAAEEEVTTMRANREIVGTHAEDQEPSP